MLTTNETSGATNTDRKYESKDFANHVGAVLRELNTVRNETKRMTEQRRQLEIYLSALKTELEQLRAEKVQLVADRIQAGMKPSPVVDNLDLVGTAIPSPAVLATSQNHGAIPAPSASQDEPELVDASFESGARHAALPVGPFSPEGVSPVDEDAFQAFLEAEEHHDKSRAWFLSNSH